MAGRLAAAGAGGAGGHGRVECGAHSVVLLPCDPFSIMTSFVFFSQRDMHDLTVLFVQQHSLVCQPARTGCSHALRMAYFAASGAQPVVRLPFCLGAHGSNSLALTCFGSAL